MFLREAGAGARKGQQSEQEVNNVGEKRGDAHKTRGEPDGLGRGRLRGDPGRKTGDESGELIISVVVQHNWWEDKKTTSCPSFLWLVQRNDSEFPFFSQVEISGSLML